MTDTTTLQKALFTIKKLKQLVKEQQENKKFEPIAIIGIGCRFPRAANKEAFWQLLCDGQNAITEFPEERWQLLQETEELKLRDKNHRYFGGFLPNIDSFDAYFFGISPREASRMDPQQRLLLEVAYEAIEDAGLPIESLAGSNTGVFASLYASQLAHLQKLDSELDALFIPTGNASSIAANRLSYLFDLRGPSFVLDTACSSSLVTLHLACLNLQNKLCDLALVCGANINLLPSINSVLAKAKMLSPDGQCKTFDATANGYVQGEGVGVIVLKPLKKAIRDNDKIYAVLNGSAVNQDGKTNGLTAPNGLQQEHLIKTAYKMANIEEKNISYVECHGTGTFLGDPIEIQALGEAIGKYRDKNTPCWIGSVKTNIGHLEPAAGIASVIKVALSLYHSKIPAHINFKTLNPHIAFDKYHLRIPQHLMEWPKYGDYRLAGVSGFGFGGTNAHIVLREYYEKTIKDDLHPDSSNPELFTISAKDPQALNNLIERWCEFLEKNSSMNFSQLCYLSHVRRSHFSYRLAIIAHSMNDLYNLLKSIRSSKNSSEVIYFSQPNNPPANATVNLETINLVDLATLYTRLANIDWNQYEKNRSFPVIDLPSYCWQHKKYWPSLKNMMHSAMELMEYPLLGKQLISPLRNLQFEFQFNTDLLPEIKDTYHILHAGYYLEMIGFVLNKLNFPRKFTIENLQFLLALIVPDKKTISVHLLLEPLDLNQFNFKFYTFNETHNKWLEHASGFLNINSEINVKKINIDKIKESCHQSENVNKLYDKILAMGMPAGESIRWTSQYFFNTNEILCEFTTPESCKKYPIFKLNFHPGLIDGCIQPLFKLVPDAFDRPYMASCIKKITFFGFHDSRLFLNAKINIICEQQIEGNVTLLDQDGLKLIEFDGILLKQLENKIQIQKLMEDSVENKIDLVSLPLAERKNHIINFLRDQVATIFSMPKEDIDIHYSLRELGLDSLMALVLMKAMESKLGTSYSLQLLLEGPSILDMTEVVLNTLANSSNKEIFSSPWIAYRKPQKTAQQRLFCFPYGGSGASIYREWQQYLPPEIEVCPIQLPGRENRMQEKPITNISEIIEDLTKNLSNLCDVPFSFYGHSFGSLIAFEFTRHLRKNNLPIPTHLFLAAFPDPRTPTRNLDRLLAQLKEISITLNDINNPDFIQTLTNEKLNQLSTTFNGNGIVDYGDHLMKRDIIKILLPIFFGDMSIIKSYQYQDELPLNIPITVFLGKNDTWVNCEDHINWKEHTVNKCTIHKFNSGHLFIKEKLIRDEIFQIITNTLNLHQTVDIML